MGSSQFRPARSIDRLELPAVASLRAEAARRRVSGEDVLDLMSGNTPFQAPRVPLEAGIKAIQQGKIGAAPDEGILDLRAAAARHLSLLSGGRPVNADNIVVSCSARQSLFNACFTLFDVGDEVLVAVPFPSSHTDLVRLSRARPVPVGGDAEWSLKVGIAELDSVANAQTKGLLLNTPVDPTGAVYTRPELRALLQWAAERRIWVVCDELYRRIHFGSGPAPSVLDLPDEMLERVVIVTGTGPTYGMAGWCVGLMLAPRAMADWVAVLQSRTGGVATHPAQWAATAALTDERTELELARIVDGYRARRDAVVEHFRSHMPGVEYVEPLGGCHFFFRVDSYFAGEINNAAAFCNCLLAELGVALMPGEAHGDDRWVRLSYTVPQKDLVEALMRISEFAVKLAERSH